MLNGSYFCTLGLSLATVILPADKSPDSLERAKGTGYSLHDLAGKVSLVLLSGAHPALLRAGAVITGGSNSTGFPRADLGNAKFTSKGNILSACQRLKAIWLALGFFFSLKIGRGQPQGQLQLYFMGTLEAHVLVCRGFGEKSLGSGVMVAPGTEKTLGQDPNSLRTRQGPKRRTGNKKYRQQPWRYAGHMHSGNPYPVPTAELHGDVYQWAHIPFCV